jgi:hypothetical protein
VTSLQEIAAALQHAIDAKVKCGSITLNFNEWLVESVETKTKVKAKALDNRPPSRRDLTA